VAKLESWFVVHGRSFPWRTGVLSEWQVLVTEILLQHTPAGRVGTLLPAFLEKWPSPSAVRAGSLTALRASLRPFGLQQQRAARLRKLAAAIAGMDDEVPGDYSRLIRMPGVGPYVANAFLAATRGVRALAIDGNVVRLVTRYTGIRERGVAGMRRVEIVASRMAGACSDGKRLNWAVLDFAGTVCKPRAPLCGACVLRKSCRSADVGRIRPGRSR
jgi:A/G-specific adenine glycosylase